MPNNLAGMPQNQFFQLPPYDRMQALNQLQAGEMSPEELMLKQLLGHRPEIQQGPSMQPSPQAMQQQGPAVDPGVFGRLFQAIFGVPSETYNPYSRASAAMAEGNRRGGF